MQEEASFVPVVFYRANAGSEPVRDWLKEQPREDRNRIGQDIMRAQFRWPVGMPLCRSLGEGLWEIWTSLGSRREARVMLCHHRGALVLLHGFLKKSRAARATDLELARRRYRDIQYAEEE